MLTYIWLFFFNFFFLECEVVLDFIRYCLFAYRSSPETETILLLSRDLGHVTASQHDEFWVDSVSLRADVTLKGRGVILSVMSPPP